MTYADVVEAVRATIAAYTHALDQGHTDDVLATYWPDGVFDFPALGTYEGLDALRGAYQSWTPRVPQRHLVMNTLVTEWSDDTAQALSDVVLLVKGDRGWSVQFVAKYHDSLQQRDGEWKFVRRAVDAA